MTFEQKKIEDLEENLKKLEKKKRLLAKVLASDTNEKDIKYHTKAIEEMTKEIDKIKSEIKEISKKETFEKTVSLRISDEQFQSLKKFLENENMSMSEYFRKKISEDVAELEEQKLF